MGGGTCRQNVRTTQWFGILKPYGQSIVHMHNECEWMNRAIHCNSIVNLNIPPPMMLSPALTVSPIKDDPDKKLLEMKNSKSFFNT